MNKEPNGISISMSSGSTKVTCDLPYDASIDDVMIAFTGMLVSNTFQYETVQDWIMDKADEISESNQINKE
jgi:hypothetical protein